MNKNRWGAALPIAAGITFLLLFVMQALISSEPVQLVEPKIARIVDYVRVPPPDDPPPPPELPERPPEPPKPPDTPAADHDPTKGARIEVTVNPPVNHAPDFARESFISDGDYLPIVRVAPMYPRRAVELELEGWVTVQFTVTQAGAVRDVVVLESSNPIFEKAAAEAAYKFRYRPRVVNGQSIEVPGVKNRFTFELEGRGAR